MRQEFIKIEVGNAFLTGSRGSEKKILKVCNSQMEKIAAMGGTVVNFEILMWDRKGKDNSIIFLVNWDE